MSRDPEQVRVEQLDWPSMLPWVRLFDSLKLSIWPGSKLFMSMLLVALLMIGGMVFDAIGGGRVYKGEIREFGNRSHAEYEKWVETKDKALDAVSEDAKPIRQGVFISVVEFKLHAFEHLMYSVLDLNIGFKDLSNGMPRPQSMVGAVTDLAFVLPTWLLREHPVFLAIWCVYGLSLWAWLGGAISRQTALQATGHDPPSAGEAMRFARGRWLSFFTVPLLPLLFAGVMAFLFLMLPGLLLNFWSNVVVGLLFAVLLLFGAVVSFILVFVVMAQGLFYPAIAVEGADPFDALSRAGYYVFGRFWHWLFYSLVTLVYGAILYVILGMVMFLTLKVTHYFTGMWVTAKIGEDNHLLFESLFPEPQMGQLPSMEMDDDLGPFGQATFVCITVWVHLLWALLLAFAINYYISAHTWIYLLLRRNADQTEFDEVHLSDEEPSAPESAVAPKKVEGTEQSDSSGDESGKDEEEGT